MVVILQINNLRLQKCKKAAEVPQLASAGPHFAGKNKEPRHCDRLHRAQRQWVGSHTLPWLLGFIPGVLPGGEGLAFSFRNREGSPAQRGHAAGAERPSTDAPGALGPTPLGSAGESPGRLLTSISPASSGPSAPG